MNPFNTAQAFGHGAEEILKFAANAIPGLEDKIKYALAAGYGADEVLKFLQNSFQGKIPKSMTKKSSGDDRSAITKSMGPHEPDPVMQMKSYAKQRNIGDLLDPGRLALQAGGAAAGFAMGGPLGAAAGAYGGTVADEEMLKKYEEHIQEGGQMSFEDYLKSIITGGAKGVGAYAVIDQAKKVLQSLMSRDQEQQKQIEGPGSPDDLVAQPGDIDVTPEGPIEQGQAEVEGALQPGTPTDLQGIGPEDSFKIMDMEGQGQVMKNLAPQLSPEDMIGVIKKLLGSRAFKALGDKHGSPTEEIITKAWEFIKASGQPGAGEQRTPQPQAPQGIPTEASVEADVLQEMAGGPAGIVPTTQAPVTQETPVTPEEMKSGRNVKQLDMGDGDESFLADIFHKTFAEPEYEVAPSDKKRTVAPLANALKSSNVRGGQWDSETGEMRIIFQPKEGTSEGGSVYTYPNVDQQAWEDLTGGKATPLTEGSNIFGFWDRGKSKSIGASFSKNIKKNADKYPPTQLAEENITVGENQIRTADRAFMVSDLFAPFKKVRAEGRREMKASDLNEWVKDYADYSPEDTYTMIEMVEEKLKGELKNYPSDARLKKEITKDFGVTFNPTEKEQEKLAAKEAKKKEQLAKKAAREAAKKRGK